jgi:hypothetical protein
MCIVSLRGSLKLRRKDAATSPTLLCGMKPQPNWWPNRNLMVLLPNNIFNIAPTFILVRLIRSEVFGYRNKEHEIKA